MNVRNDDSALLPEPAAAQSMTQLVARAKARVDRTRARVARRKARIEQARARLASMYEGRGGK